MKFEVLAVFVGVLSASSLIIGINSPRKESVAEEEPMETIDQPKPIARDEKIVLPRENISFSSGSS